MTGPNPILAEAIVAASTVTKALKVSPEPGAPGSATAEAADLTYLLFCRWFWEDHTIYQAVPLGRAKPSTTSDYPTPLRIPAMLRQMTFDVFLSHMLEMKSANLDEFLDGMKNVFGEEDVPIFKQYYYSYFQLSKNPTDRR